MRQNVTFTKRDGDVVVDAIINVKIIGEIKQKIN